MTRNLFGGIPDKAITHGFSQRRPIRSVQIPPEVGKSPTDFTDIHRFFLGRFFCHADFADDADFYIHRMTRNLFGGFPDKAITHGFSQRRPVRSVQIPPGIGICPTKKNLCISVKSVGRNNPHKEKSAPSAKSARQKKQEHISGASHWPEAKVPRNSVSNPISKNASDSSVKSDEKNEETKK